MNLLVTQRLNLNTFQLIEIIRNDNWIDPACSKATDN